MFLQWQIDFLKWKYITQRGHTCYMHIVIIIIINIIIVHANNNAITKYLSL